MSPGGPGRPTCMAMVRVHTFAISVDGFGAGPDQTEADPLGRGGEEMHSFLFTDDVHPEDQRFFDWGVDGIGAHVMGRNMFGPVRGEWPDHEWKGWWGPNPPYHHPVFVLTHHARPPLEMEGGTTFHFVTEGPAVALERAKEAAGGQDVRIGGGVSTVRHYLTTGDVDLLHVAISPTFLGSGESLFAGLDEVMRRYECTEVAHGNVAHLVFTKRG